MHDPDNLDPYREDHMHAEAKPDAGAALVERWRAWRNAEVGDIGGHMPDLGDAMANCIEALEAELQQSRTSEGFMRAAAEASGPLIEEIERLRSLIAVHNAWTEKQHELKEDGYEFCTELSEYMIPLPTPPKED